MISAKTSSLVAQIAAAVIIVLGTIAVGRGWLALKVSDIVLAAVSAAGVFCPVYASILVDKIKGGKEC